MLKDKLKDFSPLNNPQYYCNNCNYKKNVYDASCTVSKKTNCPADDQNYRDDVK